MARGRWAWAGMAMLALAMVAPAAAGPRGTAAYADPAGDAGQAPDLTRVTVDGTSGTVTIAVTAAGIGAPQTPGGALVGVYLDTDLRTATGAPGGDELALWRVESPDERGCETDAWRGGAWQPLPPPSAATCSRTGDTVTWHVADVRGPFAFHVSSGGFAADGRVLARDRAPDSGSWAYVPAAVAAVPVIGAPHATRAVAGRAMTIRFPVDRSDTGAALTTGTICCGATAAGKPVPSHSALTGGAARIDLVVPKAAKGKLLTVTVTVTFAGSRTTRVATFRVR